MSRWFGWLTQGAPALFHAPAAPRELRELSAARAVRGAAPGRPLERFASRRVRYAGSSIVREPRAAAPAGPDYHFLRHPHRTGAGAPGRGPAASRHEGFVGPQVRAHLTRLKGRRVSGAEMHRPAGRAPRYAGSTGITAADPPGVGQGRPRYVNVRSGRRFVSRIHTRNIYVSVSARQLGTSSSCAARVM